MAKSGQIDEEEARELQKRFIESTNAEFDSFTQELGSEKVNEIARKVVAEKEKIKENPAVQENIIAKAANFEELYSELEKMGGLQSARDYYDFNTLKQAIDIARKHGQLQYTTRTAGLRDKVEQLILKQQEEQEKIGSIDEKETQNCAIALRKISHSLESSAKSGICLIGGLMNGPIAVGKPIELAAGNTSAVWEIFKKGDIYLIKTEGGDYIFNPAENIKRQ